MNTADYRIGNLLRDKVSKALLEVVELTKEDVITHVIDRSMFPLKDGWGLEPIPLTHEWLIKLGFKRYKNTGNYFMDEVIQIDKKGEFYELRYYQIFIRSVNYVHELQNFYFLLKKQELKLKQS